jgi:membrane-bound serine protease (ClpP class)
MRTILRATLAVLAIFAFTVIVNAVVAESASAQDNVGAATVSANPPALKKKTRPASFKNGILIELNGEINHNQKRLVQRKLASARRAGCDLVAVEIDSPGGTVDDSLEIAEMFRDLDWAYSVAFIREHALSGAALVSLGFDEICMQANAQIGDAGVIYLNEDFMFRYAPEKHRSLVISRARDLAVAKGRSPELAEAMIDMDVVVFRDRQANSPEFISRRAENLSQIVEGNASDSQDEQKIKGEPAVLPDQANDQSPNSNDNGDTDKGTGVNVQLENDQATRESLIGTPDPARWELVPESAPKKFLVLNGARAVELGLAQATVADRNELAKHFELTQPWTIYRRTTSDNAVVILNHWLVTILLLVIGVVALYFELSAPGLTIGGLIAGLCFVLFFWSRFLGGTAEWLEVILFVSGIVCLGLELFVLPGFGIAGVLGIGLMVGSIFMASQDFVIPRNSFQLSQTISGLATIIVAGVISIVGAFMITRHFGKIPVLNNLVLAPPSLESSSNKSSSASDGAVNEKPDKLHPLVAIGQWGVADSVLRPAGRVRFGGHTLDVVTNGTLVEKGTPVRIIDIQGNIIRVESQET